MHTHSHDHDDPKPKLRALIIAGVVLFLTIWLLQPSKAYDINQYPGEAILPATITNIDTSETAHENGFGAIVGVLQEDGNSVQAYSYLVNPAVGDKVYIQNQPENDVYQYIVVERQRVPALFVAIGILFLLLLGVSRGDGLRSIYGLVGSLYIIFSYLLPSLLIGEQPLAVGLVASILVLVFSIYVAHGFNQKSLAALAGLFLTVVVVGLSAWAFIFFTQLTGTASDELFYLQSTSSANINMIGLLLAGVMIAALGSLDDIAITQASIVAELRNHASNKIELFTRAMKIGRDHISAVTNTLVLAYTAAALPLLMIMLIKNWQWDFIVSNELMMSQLVIIIFPTIGLIIAAPLTTYIATLLLKPHSHET